MPLDSIPLQPHPGLRIQELEIFKQHPEINNAFVFTVQVTPGEDDVAAYAIVPPTITDGSTYFVNFSTLKSLFSLKPLPPQTAIVCHEHQVQFLPTHDTSTCTLIGEFLLERYNERRLSKALNVDDSVLATTRIKYFKSWAFSATAVGVKFLDGFAWNLAYHNLGDHVGANEQMRNILAGFGTMAWVGILNPLVTRASESYHHKWLRLPLNSASSNVDLAGETISLSLSIFSINYLWQQVVNTLSTMDSQYGISVATGAILGAVFAATMALFEGVRTGGINETLRNPDFWALTAEIAFAAGAFVFADESWESGALMTFSGYFVAKTIAGLVFELPQECWQAATALVIGNLFSEQMDVKANNAECKGIAFNTMRP